MSKNTEKSKLNKYKVRIMRVLDEQNFVIGEREVKIIDNLVSSGRRYFFMVADRKEEGGLVERFIKIPQNNTKKLLDSFKRQIEFIKYIKSKKIISSRDIVGYNYEVSKGLPFLIMDTLPTKNVKVGFILKNKGTELLGSREAKSTIDQISNFHAIDVNLMPTSLRKILKKNANSYSDIKKRVILDLNRKVKPFDLNDKSILLHQVLEKRLEIIDFKNKIKKELDSFDRVVNSKSNQTPSLVHGDMAPNNIYVYNSSKIEILDVEWVGVTNNRAISMIIDYGNFRERAWVNKKFQKELDKELLKKYKSVNQEELGLAIIKLSIIRSAIQLSRYFENYEPEKQKLNLELRRKKSTEEDVVYALNL